MALCCRTADGFFRRVQGEPPPWTDDPVLAKFKFTNAYRASDRVSQYLIRHVIYRDDLPATAREVFFRIMVFKLFNKIETWEFLEHALGTITYEDYCFATYDNLLTHIRQNGHHIYSAAYISPPGNRVFGQKFKHQNHLLLLERMMNDQTAEQLEQVRTMQEGFEILREYPTIGDFWLTNLSPILITVNSPTSVRWNLLYPVPVRAKVYESASSIGAV